jgi:hypothetical protein
MARKSAPISFDVLLRSDASGREASAKTVGAFAPDSEKMERCRRWLAARGVTCSAANFSIACSAPPEVFAKLFRVKAKPAKAAAAQPSAEIEGSIQVPEEIAELVEQVTLTRPPEFFP